MKTTLKRLLPGLYSAYSAYKKNRILKNVLKTTFQKNALISYVTGPFKDGVNFTHTNSIESLKIAEAFKDLGYNCDVVNNDCDKNISYDKYDVILGFGQAFEKSFSTKNKAVKIYYGTGKHPYFSNVESLKRGLAVEDKKGEFLLDSLRIVEADYSLQTMVSNALIILGGESESATYQKYSNQPIYSLNVSFFKLQDFREIVKNKNFKEAGKHFLFFNGGGLIHKGLDLLLEAFLERPDLHLHICAPIETEPDFERIYQRELTEYPNIHTYGFVDIRSKIFKELLEKCVFVILPSCSEGMSTAITNVIGNAGLIPILSNAASINLGKLTIPIKDLSKKSVLESLHASQSMNEQVVKAMSEELGSRVSKECSIEKYAENIKKNIEKIIHENSL